MSVPLILTLLAGAATFIGAFLGVLGQKPSNRLLAFSLGFAAGIMLLISLMEMLPAALHAEGTVHRRHLFLRQIRADDGALLARVNGQR